MSGAEQVPLKPTDPTLGAPVAAGTRQRKANADSQSALQRTGDAFSASAKKQVGEVVVTARDAATSGAWAYPIYGLLYIISHPSLLGPVLPLLLRALLVSAGVVVGCFFFLYLPQVAWLALFTGPLAFIAAVPLVLGEAYVILNFFGKNFLFGALNTDLFDAVLVQKGFSQLVEKGRPVVTKTQGGRTVQQLGKLVSNPLNKFSMDNIVRYLITLPLNLIPVVGTAFFLGYNGYKSGPGFHGRYFQLKGYDKSRRAAFIEKRRGAYTGFGIVATLFNLVPIVSVVLSLATSVGAALWAADIEGKNVDQKDEVEVSIPPA